MEKNKYPFKLSGYIYSPGTASGFQRMKRMGIPRPLFRIEDRLARILKAQYKKLIRDLLQDVKQAAADTHVTLDQAPLTQDTLEDLVDFFEEMGKQNDIQKEIERKANLASAANTLEHKWLDSKEDQDLEAVKKLRQQVGAALEENQQDYLQRLYQDSSQKMRDILSTFEIDKQKVFNDNIDALRELYIDNSYERLMWEQDAIKRRMLQRILRYVDGQDDTLSLDDLTKYAYSCGDNLARLFARDQMARFNKALTLSTFQAAGVTKIKWVTSHDVRVRDSHKALDGQVFSPDNLPPEINDYNCRCGLVPVEWADD